MTESLRKVLFVLLAGVMCLGLCSCQESAGVHPEMPDVNVSRWQDVTDGFMGDWQGSYDTDGGDWGQFDAQVIGLGDGKYRMRILESFASDQEPINVYDVTRNGDKVSFVSANGGDDTGQGEVKGKVCKGTFSGENSGTFNMEKVVRLSPKLGATPPEGGIVLFDGTNTDQWQHPGKDGPITWILVGGAMEAVKGNIVTKKKFKDFTLHLEFRTPYMAKARGQGRGNRGVYVLGRYEVQVLDSYGLEGLDNECGGIYKIGRPYSNMCAPPGQWQSYDMTFKAAKFDNQGTKTDNALLTVVHNGVTIHDDRELPGPTGGALDGNESAPGGIFLQDHSNPVQYRNIWIVEK